MAPGLRGNPSIAPSPQSPLSKGPTVHARVLHNLPILTSWLATLAVSWEDGSDGLPGPNRLFDAAIEPGGEALRLGRAFDEHPGDLVCGHLARNLEREDDRLVVFEAELLFYGSTDFGGF